MSIRSTMNTFAVACLAVAGVGVGSAAADSTTSASGNPTGGFQCANQVGVQLVSCIGQISVLPITVDVKDVRVLNDNELTILSNDLNNLSVLDGNILDKNTILNDVELNVLTDFLDKFNIDVTKNNIDVCTAVLGIQLCR